MKLAVSFSSLDGILLGPGALWIYRSSSRFCTPIGSTFSKGMSGIGSPFIVENEDRSSLINTDEK